jgi:hypothetical protein
LRIFFYSFFCNQKKRIKPIKKRQEGGVEGKKIINFFKNKQRNKEKKTKIKWHKAMGIDRF